MEQHIDRLIEIMEGLRLHETTILTGRNGQGKSFIRKVLPQFIAEKTGDGRGTGRCVAETSLQRRMGCDLSFERAWTCDNDWMPTSLETLRNVESLLHASDRYLVIDELELGMGEELQLGACLHLAPLLRESLERNLGILVITHSRTIVENLPHDGFVNIDGMTEEEWRHRPIEPYMPEALKKTSDSLRRAIQKRLKDTDN